MKECPNCRLCFDDSSSHCPDDKMMLVATNKCGVTLDKRYILEQRLGKGGMGSVYRAKHVHLKSTHAVKIISPDVVQSDPSFSVRFTQEAILVASIQHPNIVTVTDFGVEVADTLYLVMEFIDGISLEEMLQHEPVMSPAKAFEILKPIALGVGAAHKRGIIHRDLKPLNVMIRRGAPLSQAVKVLDFGLAKIKSTESFSSLILAKTTNLLGSPHYMPPEQWDNENVDARSDIYSIGIMLFRMLTGQVPFVGTSMPNVMFLHMQAPVPSFAEVGATPSPSVEAVIHKALEKEQDKRFSTVEEMLFAYERALVSTNDQLAIATNAETVSLNEASFGKYEVPPTQAWPNTTDGKSYNLPYLDSAQNEQLTTYFNQPKPTGAELDEQLEREFINAQGRAEEARTKVGEAEKLAEAFNEAQRSAESARLRFQEAQQQLEEDVRREVQAEMEDKLAAEREARKQAEAEARRLATEAQARREAEERANQLAKTALEAQRRAQEQQEIAEREAKQRQLAEGTRLQAEKAVVNLAKEAADALRRYDEAKRQAEYEAKCRVEAEEKRKKVEEEISRIAAAEAERRRIAEEQAFARVREEAGRLQRQAIEAQEKADQARLLAETEARKREEAEEARQKAEREAKRLAEEILSAQRHLAEAEERAQLEAEKRNEEMAARIRAEESALSASREKQQNFEIIQKDLMGQLAEAQQVAKDESEKRAIEEAARKRAEEAARVNFTDSNPSEATHPRLDRYAIGIPLSDTASTGLGNTDPIVRRAKLRPVHWLAAIAGAFAVAVAGASVLYFALVPSGAASSNTANRPLTTDRIETPPAELPSRLREKMVLIKGGQFMMGRDEADPSDERIYASQFPAHDVNVDDFYLDRTEVTNDEYVEYVKAKAVKPPDSWHGPSPASGQGSFPVTGVSYFDARNFADWISSRVGIPCRLPSEQEWEYAARSGAKDYVFPWGNNWIPEQTNFASGSAQAVGSTADKTEVGGIMDMMGNVLEWTSSEFQFYPNFPTGKREPVSGKITVRGVSFTREGADSLRKTDLLLTLRQGVSPEKKFPFLGFRLACTAPRQ
jgi:serine/threonine protein kinase/formylglycine-generating enzyme required for sulfatase activity